MLTPTATYNSGCLATPRPDSQQRTTHLADAAQQLGGRQSVVEALLQLAVQPLGSLVAPRERLRRLPSARQQDDAAQGRLERRADEPRSFEHQRGRVPFSVAELERLRQLASHLVA